MPTWLWILADRFPAAQSKDFFGGKTFFLDNLRYVLYNIFEIKISEDCYYGKGKIRCGWYR